MSQRAPKKTNSSNKKKQAAVSETVMKRGPDVDEDRRRVAELTSIIQVTNFSGTIRAWKVSAAKEKKEPKQGPSKPSSRASKAKAVKKAKLSAVGRKGKKAGNTTKKTTLKAAARVKSAAVLRRELREKQQHTRLMKVLQLNRKYLLNPILHIHFILGKSKKQQKEKETLVTPAVAPKSSKSSQSSESDVSGVSQSEDWSWENTSRAERDPDPTLPIIADPQEEPELEVFSFSPKGIDEDACWTENETNADDWTMDPLCSVCGQKNHVDLPNVVSVTQFHPEESCVCCGLFHEDHEPCNMEIPVEPILVDEILL